MPGAPGGSLSPQQGVQHVAFMGGGVGARASSGARERMNHWEFSRDVLASCKFAGESERWRRVGLQTCPDLSIWDLDHVANG